MLSDSVVEIKGDKNLIVLNLQAAKELAVDGIFIAYGSVPQTALVKDIVQLDDKGYIVAGEDGFTNSADNGDCLMGFFANRRCTDKETPSGCNSRIGWSKCDDKCRLNI